jgi:phage shock protein A
MALLERVSTLLRANLNDLVEKAEDPERMLKQIVLDMENQIMQVKTCSQRSAPNKKIRQLNGAARPNWPWIRTVTTWHARHSNVY